MATKGHIVHFLPNLTVPKILVPFLVLVQGDLTYWELSVGGCGDCGSWNKSEHAHQISLNLFIDQV